MVFFFSLDGCCCFFFSPREQIAVPLCHPVPQSLTVCLTLWWRRRVAGTRPTRSSRARKVFQCPAFGSGVGARLRGGGRWESACCWIYVTSGEEPRENVWKAHSEQTWRVIGRALYRIESRPIRFCFCYYQMIRVATALRLPLGQSPVASCIVRRCSLNSSLTHQLVQFVSSGHH